MDDSLFCGPPDSPVCADNLSLVPETCQGFGVPVASHKMKGPATSLTFVGIQINTVELPLSLADDKLVRFHALMLSWYSRQAATKRELQSLIGHFSYAAFVVLPGRTFLSRVIDVMKLARHPHHVCG